MPKPKLFIYTKKEPFRDASFFIIICEGESREPAYFKFFDGMSSRVKIVSVANIAGSSAPPHLITNAIQTEEKLDVNNVVDTLWFVIDTDKWQTQIYEFRKECKKYSHWQIVQSNPCFEVWLYFHAKSELPTLKDITQCSNWKPYLPTVIRGGFNSDFHPIAIETAISNSKDAYAETGYTPEPGSTQVWQLGEALLPLVKKDLDGLMSTFEKSEVFG